MAFSLNLAPLGPVNTALGGNYSVGIFTGDGVNWLAILVPTVEIQRMCQPGINPDFAWNGTGTTPDLAVSAALLAMQAAITAQSNTTITAGNTAAALLAAVNSAIAKGT
jgi:hypothetical protein